MSISSPDVVTAVATMAETALGSVGNLGTPAQLGQLLVALFYIDRTVGGGFLHNKTTDLLSVLMRTLEEKFAIQLGHDPMYVWYLATRYGKMYAEASTLSKHELIYHAFFSEFSEKYASDADTALFRDVVEKIDYNEALFLGGLSAYTAGGSHPPGSPMIVKATHKDFHVVRSLLRRGEICIVSLYDDNKNGQVTVRATPALGKFANFVNMKCAPMGFS